LEMVLPFVFARALIRKPEPEGAHRSRWKQMIISPLSSHQLRDIVVIAVIAVGLVFSRSRMGIVAATVGLLVVTGIAFVQTRRRSALVFAFLILALPAAYALWIGLNPVVERFEVLEQPGAFEEDRLPLWRDTAVLIRDYPMLGTGLGTYRWANAHYQTYMLSGFFEHAHNDYLELAADIGIPATLLLFGSVWILAIQITTRAPALKHTSDKILAAGCAGAMVALLVHEIADFNLQVPANAFIFAWIAGTGAALVRRPVAPSETGARR